MSDEILSEINKKLDTLIALSLLRDINDDTEKVLRLRGLGLDYETIAALTGLTENAARLRVSRSRPGKKEKK